MKELLAIVMLINIGTNSVLAQSQSVKMQKLLDANRLFELRDSFDQNQGQLSKWDELYYRAYIANAFGQPEESNRAIDAIFAQHSTNFSKRKLGSLLACASDNYSKINDYQAAIASIELLVEKYGRSIKKSQRKELDNIVILWKSLINVPSQRVNHATATQIPIIHNQFNHWLIPVRSNVQSADTIQFVFDTGANLSTIRAGVAERMGVIRTGQNMDVGNSVGSLVQAEIGYIPTICIGDMELENVVVLIFPDQMLTFEQINYQIDGIIGFPVIQALGEFSISNDQILRISPENSPNTYNNLFVSGLTPFVRIMLQGENLTMLCDTGALSSYLSERYYRAHRNYVDSNSTKISKNVGGAGDSKDITNRIIANPILTVADRQFVPTKLDVFTKKFFKAKPNDGFLGQDILLEPREVVMNFRDMYIFFRD